jgi:NAD(P)-dependent dehydrogenase (short-subunit alcohol dehydrogenase family)
MIDLKRKVVLLAGGFNSLTTGIARRIAEAGAEVVIGCESETCDEATILAAALTSMSRGPRPARTVTLNLGDQAALVAQIAAMDWIDIALISPGWYDYNPFLKTTLADWDVALARNFEQVTFVAQAVARKMIAQANGGRIIFLSSIAALQPSARMSAVGTSLSALHVIARIAAADLGPHRITCNVVAMGWIEADPAAEFYSPDGRAYLQQGISLGRIGAPADVGDVCCFLASEYAGYLTGAIIPVDGGFTITKMDGPLGTPDNLKWT